MSTWQKKRITLPRVIIFLSVLAAGVILCSQWMMAAQNIEVRRDITYRNIDSISLHLDLFQPADIDAPIPVILLIHGGSWMAGSREQVATLARWLAGNGYAVVTPDYRLVPRCTYPGQLEDVCAAARWTVDHAEEYHLDSSRFIVMGASAGGQLAGLIATVPRQDLPDVRCVVTFSSPMDLTTDPPDLRAEMVVRAYLGATQKDNPELYAEASPITHISKDTPPFMLVHGTKDDVVPFSQSERMANALRDARAPVEFLPMKNVAHILPSPMVAEDRVVLRQVLAFLNRHVPQAP